MIKSKIREPFWPIVASFSYFSGIIRHLMRIKGISFFLVLFSWLQPTFAQVSIPTDAELAKASDEQKIEAAENFYDKQMYQQSLRIWKNLLNTYPDNARINYMAGKGMMLSNRDRAKSIYYFKKTLGHDSSKLNFDKKHCE